MDWFFAQSTIPDAIDLGSLRGAVLVALGVMGVPASGLVRRALRRSSSKLCAEPHDEPIREAA